jgi:pilus assembly protein CpaB
MMERRAFLISITLSVLSMYLVYGYVSGQSAELEAKYGMPYRKMVVARRDILQYETVRPVDVEEMPVPNALIPPGMIENQQDVIDAVAAVPIMKGEQILDNKIISKNIYSGLDTQVTLGRRAISIPVNQKSSVGFMVRPGNRVDLAAHFEYRAQGTSIEEVKVFMQDLLILASGRTIQSNPPKGVDQGLLAQVSKDQKIPISKNRGDVQETLDFVKQDPLYQTVTLEVTPEQAQKIFYVMAVYGDSMTLMLRNPNDRQLSSLGTTDFADVMGRDSFYVNGPKQAPPRAVPRPKFYDYVGDQPVPVY